MDHSRTKVTKHGEGGESRGDWGVEAGRSHHVKCQNC